VGELMLVRQPILSADETVAAYDLQYAGLAAGAAPTQGPVDFDCLDNEKFKKLTRGKLGLVRVPLERVLEMETAPFGSEIGLLVPSSGGPSAELLDTCRRLRATGCVLALDDSSDLLTFREHAALFDVVNVDFAAHGSGVRRAAVASFGPADAALLATSLDGRGEFDTAREMGYTYFEGAFFCEPTTLRGTSAQVVKHNALLLLQEVNRPVLDWGRIEEVVKRDATMSYALLRYMNSVALGVSREITSIHHAVVMLGEREFRRWASLFALADMAEGRPPELVFTGVLRAGLDERLAVPSETDPDEAFLVGLLSVTDALLGCPVAEAIADVPVAREVKAALYGFDNQLHRVHELALACESADWEGIAEKAAGLCVDLAEVATVYVDAVEWASQLSV